MTPQQLAAFEPLTDEEILESLAEGKRLALAIRECVGQRDVKPDKGAPPCWEFGIDVFDLRDAMLVALGRQAARRAC